jgi:hypothetical protein
MRPGIAVRWFMCTLIACGGTAQIEAPEPVPVVPTKTSSPMLTPEAQAAIDAHLAQLAGADLCASMETADALVRALYVPLQSWWTRELEKTTEAGGADISGELAAIEAQVPGLSLVHGSEGVAIHAVYADLATAIGQTHAALAPIDTFLNTGFGGWVTQTWDLGGCANLAGGEATLAPIAAGWTQLPACARVRLAPRLRAGIQRMADWNCYCDDKATVRSHIREIAPVLESLRTHGGKQALRSLRSNLSDSSTRYQSSCAG